MNSFEEFLKEWFTFSTIVGHFFIFYYVAGLLAAFYYDFFGLPGSLRSLRGKELNDWERSLFEEKKELWQGAGLLIALMCLITFSPVIKVILR